MAVSDAYRPGLIWENDSLVWEGRTLQWEGIPFQSTRIGNVLMVKRSRAKVLKVKNSRWRRRAED